MLHTTHAKRTPIDTPRTLYIEDDEWKNTESDEFRSEEGDEDCVAGSVTVIGLLSDIR
jgi:hypothetical protein